MQATDHFDHTQDLIARHFGVVDGQLTLGELPIGILADKHQTPLYVYDRAVLEQTWQSVRAAFPAEFDIYYSIKANPNRAVLQFFLQKGCGLEVASSGEIERALDAGGVGQSLLFAGPGKTDAELHQAVSLGIGEIHAESRGEIERIAAIAAQWGRQARIALRVNPTGQSQGGAMRMGGKPAPFGIDEEQLTGAVEQVEQQAALELTGVHLFSGTQILDHQILLGQYQKALETARSVARQIGRPLQTIDFGGGLGIPYFAHERRLDLKLLATGLQELLETVRRDPLLNQARLIVEPGRLLVGEAGLYVARITDIKVSRGKKFLIVDGGMHQHLAASGNLGQTIKRNYPVAILNKLDRRDTEKVDVVGPLCTPLDVLARNIELPAAEVGDLVGVLQSGAYGRTASPLGFLSHAAPPEIWVEAGQDRVICPRGAFSSLQPKPAAKLVHLAADCAPYCYPSPR